MRSPRHRLTTWALACVIAGVCSAACSDTPTAPPPPASARPDAMEQEAAAPAAAPAVDAGPTPSRDAATPDAAPTPAPPAPTPAAPDAGADLAVRAPVDARPDQTSSGEFHLESTGFLDRGGERVFPASSSYPQDQSPPFTFHGVPAGAKSLVITFVDRSIDATKWVVWDIPPNTPGLPGNMSKTPHPAELPTSTQRGSLGRTGYSGPGVRGPPLHTYDWVLYAVDVAKLPVPPGANTTEIRKKILPMHTLAKTPVFSAKGQLGGP